MRTHTDRRNRKQIILKVSVVAFLAAMLGCSSAPAPNPPVAEQADAEQILREMSETLASARQLTFKVTRELDRALADSSPLPVSAVIEVAVSRPNKLKGQATSDAGVRRFYADGQNFTLLDESMKLYSTVPMPGTIDEMVGRLDEKFGFTPPLAEFVLNDPYQRIKEQAQSSTYRGKETVGGTECHHLALTGEVADVELWVAIGDKLPQKFVATFKDREGNPQLKMDFSDWNLAAKLEDSFFIFQAPKDAEKINMVPVEGSQGSEQGGKPKQK